VLFAYSYNYNGSALWPESSVFSFLGSSESGLSWLVISWCQLCKAESAGSPSPGKNSLSSPVQDLTVTVRIKVKVILRPTVSRPVCLGIRHPFWAYDQIFVTVRKLRVCSCGAPSLTRGRVCRLQLLLAFASAVIFGSESHGTREHILQSEVRDLPFRRLLRLAGLRWRYSTRL
jgi:hypothetical protein